MAFLIYTQDVEGGAEIRKEQLQAHLDYLDQNVTRLIASGGIMNIEGTRPIGGLIIVDVDTEEEALAFAKADPFGAAGLFKEIRVQRWKQFYLHGRPDRGPFAPLDPQ